MSLVLPLLGLVALSAVVSATFERVGLLRAARLIFAGLVAVSLATLPIIIHFAIGVMVALPLIGTAIHDVLHVNGIHSDANFWLGFVAATWLLVACGRAFMLVGRYRSSSVLFGDEDVVVVSSREPLAYTMPGRHHTMVVSQGLVAMLSKTELDVVRAHESAHARLRHDRAILIGRLCVIVVPFVRPLMNKLEYLLERIADESAAAACGDRRLVADTLAKVALGGHIPQPALGIAKSGVTARVRALDLHEPIQPVWVRSYAVSIVTTLVALSVLQWHHVVIAVQRVCGI